MLLVVSGITCFVVLGRFILPKGEDEKSDDQQTGDSAAFPQTAETQTGPAEIYELRTPDDLTKELDHKHRVLLESHKLRAIGPLVAGAAFHGIRGHGFWFQDTGRAGTGS